MTSIDAARKVTAEKTCYVLRPRLDGTVGQYDSKPFFGKGHKRGWFYLDLFTASHIVALYNALNETNKAKYASLPIMRQAELAFRLIRKRE